MSDFTRLTTPKRVGDDTFRAVVPDGWQQGRGAFGGLVLATMARAAEAFDGAGERTLRSITAEICAPVPPGEAVIRVSRLRTGSGVSTVAARIEGDGEVRAHAVCVLGKTRGADTDFCDLRHPDMPPWPGVPPMPMAEDGPWPPFARFLEFRPAGPPPFASGPDAAAWGWVRFRDPGPARDAAFLVAMIDAWWPAIFARWAAPRPMATLAFTAQIVGDTAGLDPDWPLACKSRAVAGRGGYVVETRELYGGDGRLLALSQQTLAVIK